MVLDLEMVEEVAMVQGVVKELGIWMVLPGGMVLYFVGLLIQRVLLLLRTSMG
jgi:hypothetical protein